MARSSSRDGSDRTLKTVETAFDVIGVLKERDGATVTDAAARLDMSKSTVYNYLATLEEQGYVEKTGDTYHLSLAFSLLGQYVRSRNPLYDHGREELDRLAAETGDYVHLATEHEGLSLNLYKVWGDAAEERDYQMSKLHTQDYLHFSATGKAILAALPDRRVEEIARRHGLPAKTPNTITDLDALLEALESVRERGYATNDEEEVEGYRAVGTAITDNRGGVLGSISVSGPTSRMDDDRFHDTIPSEVIRTANLIEVNINMSTQEATRG